MEIGNPKMVHAFWNMTILGRYEDYNNLLLELESALNNDALVTTPRTHTDENESRKDIEERNISTRHESW